MRLFRHKTATPAIDCGCVGCSRVKDGVRDHICDVCGKPAQGALLTYCSPSPLTGFRKWYYLCAEHDRELADATFVNVGGDGPFDQDLRLRMFTEGF